MHIHDIFPTMFMGASSSHVDSWRATSPQLCRRPPHYCFVLLQTFSIWVTVVDKLAANFPRLTAWGRGHKDRGPGHGARGPGSGGPGPGGPGPGAPARGPGPGPWAWGPCKAQRTNPLVA